MQHDLNRATRDPVLLTRVVVWSEGLTQYYGMVKCHLKSTVLHQGDSCCHAVTLCRYWQHV